jgi:hypothetical protein
VLSSAFNERQARRATTIDNTAPPHADDTSSFSSSRTDIVPMPLRLDDDDDDDDDDEEKNDDNGKDERAARLPSLSPGEPSQSAAAPVLRTELRRRKRADSLDTPVRAFLLCILCRVRGECEMLCTQALVAVARVHATQKQRPVKVDKDERDDDDDDVSADEGDVSEDSDGDRYVCSDALCHIHS